MRIENPRSFPASLLISLLVGVFVALGQLGFELGEEFCFELGLDGLLEVDPQFVGQAGFELVDRTAEIVAVVVPVVVVVRVLILVLRVRIVGVLGLVGILLGRASVSA